MPLILSRYNRLLRPRLLRPRLLRLLLPLPSQPMNSNYAILVIPRKNN